MKELFAIFCLFLTICLSAQNKSQPITSLDIASLNNAILVDVRTAEEYEQGHLEGAQNFDWFADDFAENFKNIPKDRKVYVYCKKGGRSSKAQEKLNSMGFLDVVNLSGGYDAYLESKK